MLNLSNRDSFHTLLSAVTLTSDDDQKPALIYIETGVDDLIITRAEFKQAIQNYASGLQQMGVSARDLVILAHTQNLESIYAFWGALLIGAIPSMFPTLTEKLDHDIYMNSMSELVQLSDVRAILTTDEFAIELSGRVNCPVYGSQTLLESVSNVYQPYTPDTEEIAFLQHSSGTTGLQKGVALSHTAVLNQIASYSDALQLAESDVVVSWLPLYHDMGLIAGFLMPLIQGTPLVLMSPFDWVKSPAMLLRAIDDYQGTLCWLPNFAYNHMARRIRKRDVEGLSLASMRAFINCSEPVHASSHQLFLDKYGELGVNENHLTVSYAMAENTFAVTQTPMGTLPIIDIINRLELEKSLEAVPVFEDDANALVKVSCGKTITNTQIKVVDSDGKTLTDRRVGELLVTSDCMLSEYYKRDDLNPFDSDGWYKTGDRGYMVDGEVFVIGRSKDLIINAGKNVYPQDLESVINHVDGVHPGRAVVFGVYDEKEGTELIAVVAEVDTEDDSEHKTIFQNIKQAVATQSTVTIHYVHLVGEKWLIKTSSGKIARAANRDKWLQETGRYK
jgi:fatty-acyl-CoA synthase